MTGMGREAKEPGEPHVSFLDSSPADLGAQQGQVNSGDPLNSQLLPLSSLSGCEVLGESSLVSKLPEASDYPLGS